jgi:hypothetical protein
VAKATPWPNSVPWGWPDHAPPTDQTIFLKKFDLAVAGGRSTPKGHGVASATSIRPVWGGFGHLHGFWGWIGHSQQLNQFFQKNLFGPWGWSNHPKGHLNNKNIFLNIKNYFFIFLNIK